MADTVVYTPDNQANNMFPYYLAGQNNGNGFFGGNGGSAFWGALLGSVVPGLFGAWGNGGFGGFNGGNGAAAALGAQATANNNAELILNAINGTDADVRLLATTLNSDVDSIRLGINTVQGAIAQVASQVGMSGLQVVNAIQAGNSDLASRLCSCCCDMKQLVTSQGYENQLATLAQTNALTSAIAGVNENIAANRAAQQLSDCQQTYAITDTMNRNYLALDNKIDALESSRKDREITALTAQVAKLESQNFTAGAIGSAIAPVNAALNALAKEVDDIKCKQPSTVSVQYPNLVAMNATPYVSGGYYQGNGGYYGPGFGFGFNNGFGF